MNILIVTAMFPPIRTGTSFYSKNLANALHSIGHNVTLVTAKNRQAEEDNYPFKIYRLQSLHINVNSSFKHLRFCSIFPSNYSKLVSLAREHRIEVIILVNHYLDIAFPAIFCSLRLRKPLFISVGTQMQSLNPFRNRILRLLDRIICGRLIFPFSTKIISWDSEIERYIKEVQREKVWRKSVIIPFGSNVDSSQTDNYRHDYKRIDQIVGIGAIISQRDYLFNLRVFNELLKQFPNLRLRIIGHIYIQSPKALAKELGIYDKVDFLGEVPHEVVVDELKKSALHWMMLSGEYVGLGTATLEAMSLGIPCVSNVPENLFGNRLLKDMENFIFADKNVCSVNSKITGVLLDEPLRKRIGENGRYFIRRHLSWDTVARSMTEHFHNFK